MNNIVPPTSEWRPSRWGPTVVHPARPPGVKKHQGEKRVKSKEPISNRAGVHDTCISLSNYQYIAPSTIGVSSSSLFYLIKQLLSAVFVINHDTGYNCFGNYRPPSTHETHTSWRQLRIPYCLSLGLYL